MTIDTALSIVDETKPNQISRELKIRWLDELDNRIYREILLTHKNECDLPVERPHYTETTEENTVLLVPSPYDGIYRWYIEMQIDLVNLETDKYQNSFLLFNNAWSDYARAYHRKHMPIDRGIVHQF